MNRIRHFKGKVLALAPAIALAGIMFNAVVANAEVIHAVSPDLEVNPSGVPINTENFEISSPEATSAPTREPINFAVMSEIPTSSEIRSLEVVSTGSKDLLVEAPPPPTPSQPSALSQTPTLNDAALAPSHSLGQRLHLTGDWDDVLAPVEVVDAVSPDLEVNPSDVPINAETNSREATSAPTREPVNFAVMSEIPDSSEIRSLEVVSTSAKDLLVEAAPPPTSSQPSTLSQTSTPNDASAPSQSLGQRSRLTGDWGGFRTQLEATGITLNFEFTQFYQGVVPGTGDQAFDATLLGDIAPGSTFEYGGRLDAFVDLDFGNLGLWQGGGFTTHLEYRFGDLAGGVGGTFFPTNSAMEFPSDSPDTLVATSLYLSQRFGNRASLLIGKINALDLLENDLFFGGLGNRRFMNAVFAAPPSGLIPSVMFGAIANVRLDPVTVSFWVYDPDDRTQDYWPDDLFANGVSFSLTTTYSTQIAGRPTTFSLNGIYTTKTGVDFSEVSEAYRSGIEPSTRTGSYSIGFQFSHLFHQNPSNPRQGWGLFMKGALSDGNPNYIQSSIIAGIGGTGLFPGRELDSFGLGYYYYNLSDDLQESLNDLSRRVSLGDEQGLEVYYSFAMTPWFYLTADLQYIRPPRSSYEDVLIGGLRANIRF